MSGTEEPIEIWNVAMASGEIRSMTVDELDTAFDDGSINVNTRVLPPGTTEWVRLGKAAGLDSPQTAPVAPSLPPPPPVQSFPPVAFDGLGSSGSSDFDPALLNPPKNRGILYGLGGVAVFGILFAAFSGSEGPPATNAAAGLAVNAAKPTPAAVDVAPQKPAQTAAPAAAQLTDEQRKALLEADKKVEAKRKGKGAPVPGGRGPTTRPNEANPFNNGGDAHDPLNSKL